MHCELGDLPVIFFTVMSEDKKQKHIRNILVQHILNLTTKYFLISDIINVLCCVAFRLNSNTEY